MFIRALIIESSWHTLCHYVTACVLMFFWTTLFTHVTAALLVELLKLCVCRCLVSFPSLSLLLLHHYHVILYCAYCISCSLVDKIYTFIQTVGRVLYASLPLPPPTFYILYWHNMYCMCYAFHLKLAIQKIFLHQAIPAKSSYVDIQLCL